MAVKIRLQRHGHKDYAFYPIVIADSRAPRDGRFIERIGSYNPNTNPATISLNFDRALYWINVGAQPTETVRNILSREGNPKTLGYTTCTFIGLTLERGSMYKTVVPELEKIPEVVEVHFTTGSYTMMIKLYARDNQHLMELLNGKIQHIPGVMATETLISLEQGLIRQVPINYND